MIINNLGSIFLVRHPNVDSFRNLNIYKRPLLKLYFNNNRNIKTMNFKFLKPVLLTLLFSFGTSCSKKIYIFHRNPNKAHAPGQVKKYTGSKSAKPYAPGQIKKKNN